VSITKERGARFAQLLLRAIEDPETRDLDEALAVAELAMQDDIALALDAQGNFHGPQPPGPGWVQVGVGPQGGKVWRQSGQKQAPQQPTPQQQTAPRPSPPTDDDFFKLPKFGPANPPKVGQQILYYDGEGGGSRLPPLRGPILDISGNKIIVRARTGSKIAIDLESARPEPASASQPPAQPKATPIAAQTTVPVAAQPIIQQAVAAPAVSRQLPDRFEDLHEFVKYKMHKGEPDEDVAQKMANALGSVNPGYLTQLKEKYKATDRPSLARAILNRDKGLFAAPLSLSAYFAHDIFDRRAQGILNRTMTVAKQLSATAKRELRDALQSADPSEMGHQVVTFVNKYRLQLADLLGTTQLAALLAGASEVAERLPPLPQAGSAPPPPPTLPPDEAQSLLFRLRAMPQGERDRAIYELPPAEQHYVQQSLGSSESIPPTRPFTPQAPPGGERVHYPIIEEAARELARKNVVTRPVFDKLDDAARQKAFTVAGVDAQETLTKIRDALAENVAEGADVEAFREKVLEQVAPGTFLSEGHLENVARTNIQRAFSDGQETVLSHPFVRSGFPYRARDAIHDNRVRENHLALEKLGIQGTNIYRAGDPVWQMFRVPWDYNDRCADTPITIRQAAERGITEAQEWLRTGVEPSPPAFVPMPSFQPPPGFQRALESAPLSIRLAATLPSAPTGPELHEDTATIDMAGSGGGLPATPGDFAVEGKHTKKPGKSKGRRGRRKRVTRAARKWRVDIG